MTDTNPIASELAARVVTMLKPDASDVAYDAAAVNDHYDYGRQPVWYATYAGAIVTLSVLDAPASAGSVAHAIATAAATAMLNAVDDASSDGLYTITVAALLGRDIARAWRRLHLPPVPPPFADAFPC